MRIKGRRRKLIALLLTVAMISVNLGIIPVFAEEEMTPSTEEVSFNVREGDLLIAVNPRPWEVAEILPEEELIGWNTFEQNLGTAGITKTDTAFSRTDKDGSYSPASERKNPRSGTAGLKRKMKEWFDAHPESKMPEAAALSDAEKPESYEVGDIVTHGYDSYLPEKDKLQAERIMGDAPVYCGDRKLSDKEKKDYITSCTQIDDDNKSQVYRRYKCLAVGNEFTVWGYVYGSETTEEPDEDEYRTKDISGNAPTYLSENGAAAIKDELDKMDFMKKLETFAGDYTLTDKLGDADGKIAFFIEPINTGYYGFFYCLDHYERSDYFDPAFRMDGLHVQMKKIAEGEPPYATMAHELSHYIADGYDQKNNTEMDLWMGEWFAQAVMLEVIPWSGPDTGDPTITNDVRNVVRRIRAKGMLDPYACPPDTSYSSVYETAVLLSGYFTGRFGTDIWRRAVENGKVTEETFSRFIKEQKNSGGKNLEWWLSAFGISLFQNLKGKEIYSDTYSEYALIPYDPYEDHSAERYKTPAGTHRIIADRVVDALKRVIAAQETAVGEGEKKILRSISELDGKSVLTGGGTACVFEVGEDLAGSGVRKLTIKGSGEDIVWAHKDVMTGIVEVASMPEERTSENKAKPSDNRAERDEDGNWVFTSAQQEALSVTEGPSLFYELSGSDSDVVINLYSRRAVSYNAKRSRIKKSLVDLDRSGAVVNGTTVKIKKIGVKNAGTAYVSEDSIFSGIVSENNLEAYAKLKKKKKPCYYLVLDTRRAPSDVKQAVRQINKKLRRDPIYFEILPVTFTKRNVMVEYDEDRGRMKKLFAADGCGNVKKLKGDRKSKKDYITQSSEDEIIITGTNNFNGSFSYHPLTHTITLV